MHLHLKLTALLLALLGSFGCATTQSSQAGSSAATEQATMNDEEKAVCCKDGRCAHAKAGEARADCCGKDGTCKTPECVKSECCKKGTCGKADCCKKSACQDGKCQNGRCAHHAKKAGKKDPSAAFSGPSSSLLSFPDPRASTKGLDFNMIVDDPALALAIVTLRNGTPLPEHVRNFPVTIQAFTGSGTVTAGGQTFELGAGQVVVLAPHVPHMIQPNGTEPLTLVVHQLRAGATAAPDATTEAPPAPDAAHAH